MILMHVHSVIHIHDHRKPIQELSHHESQTAYLRLKLNRIQIKFMNDHGVIYIQAHQRPIINHHEFQTANLRPKLNMIQIPGN